MQVKRPSDLITNALMIAVAILYLISTPLLAADIDGIRLWRAPDHTRVVFDLTGPVDHKIFSLNEPKRLVVDISNGRNRSSLAGLDLTKTPIKRIRSATREQNQLRFVFDLSATIKPRSFFLKKHGDKPDRLVVDLYDKTSSTQKTVTDIAEAAAVSTRRDILIVVDAGHGGEDPGAIGPRRVKEKVVVLDIAKKLAKQLNNTPGYKAKLTRTADYYVPLRKRRDFARKHRADLFVSIHADAFKTPEAKGASVFALSRRGATSETARFLAKRENAADLIGGVGDVSLNDKDDVLKGVLVDLSMTATLSSSIDAGSQVLKQMGGIARLHKSRVEQAGFLVLKSPDVPSILVETGFISNPKEAKRLATESYRTKMASSILKGIRGHFEKSPPAGTYLAWKQAGGKEETIVRRASNKPSLSATKFHTVVRGDTLSDIAEKYQLSLFELKALNGLSKNTIGIGQKLKVGKEAIVTASASEKKVHTVRRGETLSDIAEDYGLSIRQLKQLNQLTKDTIRIGQKLVITNHQVVAAKKQKTVHKVSSGETLSGIALRYSSTVAAIRKTNKLSSSAIRIGQKLVIPAG